MGGREWPSNSSLFYGGSGIAEQYLERCGDKDAYGLSAAEIDLVLGKSGQKEPRKEIKLCMATERLFR